MKKAAATLIALTLAAMTAPAVMAEGDCSGACVVECGINPVTCSGGTCTEICRVRCPCDPVTYGVERPASPAIPSRVMPAATGGPITQYTIPYWCLIVANTYLTTCISQCDARWTCGGNPVCPDRDDCEAYCPDLAQDKYDQCVETWTPPV